MEDHENIKDTEDSKTGIRVWSLYGQTRRPTPEMLKDVDVLVFDIQDIGVRFYTYESTMAYAMEEAARAKLPFYVLDRPNPITGTHVEGPMLDADQLSFTGSFPLPLRHGMTIGELAKLINGEKHWNADPACRGDDGVEPGGVVRCDGVAVDCTFAEYPDVKSGDFVSWPCAAGSFDKLFRGPGYRRSF